MKSSVLPSTVVNEILAHRLDLVCVDGYFIMSPFDKIAVGLACNSRPHGVTVLKFYYPLFDCADFIHVGFCEHLRDGAGFIDFAKTPRTELGAELLRRMKSVEYEKPTVEQFVSFVEGRTELTRNPSLALTYATALVLLNKMNNAKSLLSRLSAPSTHPVLKTVSTRAKELLDLLNVSESSAKEFIENRIAEVQERMSSSLKC